jgi:carbon storage regulator CsrA
MLVLARKVDESILIGDDIHVKIVSIEKGIVKLGIDAPSDIVIIRDELAKDIADINKQATSFADSEKLSKLSKLLKK